MKKEKKLGMHKLNNKGLSLVEVLVAMLILAMVSIVFLRSFTYSVQLNSGAKVKQYAVSLAQSLMESVKAYDRETLDVQFSSAVSNSSFKIYMLTDGDGSTKDVSVNGEERVYRLQNLDFNGKKYDATIDVKPTTTTAQLLTVETVNKYNDAFFKQLANEQSDLVNAISQKLNDLGDITGVLDVSKVQLNSREVDVIIGADDKVTVEVVYDYIVDDYTIIKADLTTEVVDITSAMVPFSVTYDCYDNTATKTNGARLEKLYMYYYPAYSSAGSGWLDCADDKINIVNNSSTLKEIYIVKQKNTALSDTRIAIGEATYSMDVSCSTVAPIDIYHNLGTKLAGAGSGTYSINGADVTDKGTPWVEDASDTVLVYSVEVNIMEHGGSDVLCALNGTTNIK